MSSAVGTLVSHSLTQSHNIVDRYVEVGTIPVRNESASFSSWTDTAQVTRAQTLPQSSEREGEDR